MKPDKIKKAKSFTVDRRKWLRGMGPETSALLKNNGHKCCVGFYAQACGLPSSAIRNVFTLDSVENDLASTVDSPKMDCIYVTNDAEDIADSDRERKLRELFARMGVRVKFTG